MTISDVQPGAVVRKNTYDPSRRSNKTTLTVITHVIFGQKGHVAQIVFDDGDCWHHARWEELQLIGSIRLDANIELGSQVEYGESRKEVSLSQEDLARIKETAPGLEE